MLWISENLQVCFCLALSCVTSAAAVIHVSGYEGKRVNITCLYDAGFESYEKYLCRSYCQEDPDVVVRSTESRKGRYFTSDSKKKRIFTVTISDLSSKDAGKYWCGVTKYGFDKFPSEVLLKVEKEWCCVKTNKMSGTVGSSIAFLCPYPQRHQDERKFLCKGDHRDNCTDLVLDGENFTLQNVSSSSFLVMVIKLEEGDAGTYWCGSDSQWGPGNYIKIELSVEWGSVKMDNIWGSLGYPVTFSCPYSRRHHGRKKFFCKGDQRSNCTDMLSQSRFTLQEDESSRSFSVMVTKLEESDAGTYWCGSNSKWISGNYTKIELSVEWCCVKTEKVSGTVGHSLVLSCPYPPQHWENGKFICKGEQRDNCTAVLLSQSRFTLQDDKSSNSFLVTISKLDEGDAGTYWCGSDSKWSAGNYTKIELAVGANPLRLVIYIILTVFLGILLAVFIAYKCKWKGAGARKDKMKRKLETLEMICEKPEDSVYNNCFHTGKEVDIQENVYENLTTADVFSVYM